MNRNFILYLVSTILLLIQINAQAIDNVYFHSNDNFTYCYQSNSFTIAEATRYYNAKNATYFLNISSTTNVNVSNLNQQGTTTAASFFEIRFGFKTFQAQPQQFCLDVVNQQCPLEAYQNFTIQRDFNLTNTPFYPLADITARYSAIDADSNHLVCLNLAPVGYQHPVWQSVLTYVPMGITGYAALLSVITSLTRFHEHGGQHDIFLFSSNDAMLPGVLRLKTPGFFDVMFYSQFIVITGLLSLDYPRFVPLFVSDFAWSFLLFDAAPWMGAVQQRLFPSSSSAVESIATVPHQTLYKRQQPTESLNIINSGMLNFTNALGIDINALFFIFLIYFLMVVAGCLFLCCLTWFFLHLIGRVKQKETLIIKSKRMMDFTIGVMIRIISLFYLPLLTLSFFQLMIQTYWYITFAAALFISVSLLVYGFVSIKLLQIRPASFIYTDLKLLLRYGSLYNLYTDATFHFYLAVLVSQSVIAAMIGLFQTSGVAQLVVLLLVQVAFTAGTCWQWPYPDSQVNILQASLQVVKTVVLFLHLSFLPPMHTTTMAKQYMGYVLLAIHCLVYIMFLLLLIKHTVILLTGLGDDELDESGNPPARMVLWRKHPPSQRHSARPLITTTTSSRSSMLVQGQEGPVATQETLDLLQHYYHPQKPDEIKRVSLPILESRTGSAASLPMNLSTSPPSTSSAPPPRGRQYYVAQVNLMNPDEDETAIVRQNYRLDDAIIPASEPLIRPPPLPKHNNTLENESSLYSPPHQPSISSGIELK